MTKSFVVGLIALLVVSSKVLAQEDPEFQKWLKQQQSEYRAYVDKLDREFAEFLQKEWRGVELMRGSRPDSLPKPHKIPVFVRPAGEPAAKSPEERPTRLPVAPAPQPVRTPMAPPDCSMTRLCSFKTCSSVSNCIRTAVYTALYFYPGRSP